MVAKESVRARISLDSAVFAAPCSAAFIASTWVRGMRLIQMYIV